MTNRRKPSVTTITQPFSSTVDHEFKTNNRPSPNIRVPSSNHSPSPLKNRYNIFYWDKWIFCLPTITNTNLSTITNLKNFNFQINTCKLKEIWVGKCIDKIKNHKFLQIKNNKKVQQLSAQKSTKRIQNLNKDVITRWKSNLL